MPYKLQDRRYEKARTHVRLDDDVVSSLVLIVQSFPQHHVASQHEWNFEGVVGRLQVLNRHTSDQVPVGTVCLDTVVQSSPTS